MSLKNISDINKKGFNYVIIKHSQPIKIIDSSDNIGLFIFLIGVILGGIVFTIIFIYFIDTIPMIQI